MPLPDPAPRTPELSTGKAGALAWSDAQASFLLSRRVANCSNRTVGIYEANLSRFAREAGIASLADATPLAVQRHLTALRDRLRPISVHQHYRNLRTLFAWCVEAGLIAATPMRGVWMQVPKTLPRVPEDEHVRRLLAACDDTFEGRRNRALVSLLADGGLRISEALRLRIEDVRFGERTIAVRGGKGGKDGAGFFGAEAAQVLRTWIGTRRDAMPEDFLFVDRGGRPLSRYWATQILHKLSVRAGLPRKIGPHALRHYAAISIHRQTGDLELVRQVLRHESLAMALRYARMTQVDVSRKFRRASPLDNLRAGR